MTVSHFLQTLAAWREDTSPRYVSMENLDLQIDYDLYHFALKVTDVDLHEFREMIGPSQVLTSGEDDLSAFNTDWMRALR